MIGENCDGERMDSVKERADSDSDADLLYPVRTLNRSLACLLPVSASHCKSVLRKVARVEKRYEASTLDLQWPGARLTWTYHHTSS